MCDHTLKFFHILLPQENIFSFESKWGHFIYHVVPKNVKVSVKAILTTRIFKNWKQLQKALYETKCLQQAIFDYTNKKLPKSYAIKPIYHKKSNFKVDILETMKQMHFFENSSFLGTTCHIKCPHSLSNENLFSCDNKMWENFSV